MEFIRGLAAEGTSVLFSTHDVAEVQRYAARALVLADGELLFDGTPAEFLAEAGRRSASGTSRTRSSRSCVRGGSDDARCCARTC